MSADKDAGTGGAERGRGPDHEPDPYLLRTTGPDQIWPGSGRNGEPRGDDGDGDTDDRDDAEVADAIDAEVVPDGPDGSDEVGTPGGDELASCLAQRDEYLDSLRRLQAEFENYKKRVIKQQADQVARAAVSLLEKILPVLDTLDLAIEHMGDPGSVDGRALEAVSSQLRDVLAKEGLERISPIGEHFDPTAHEAVGHLPAEAGAVGDDQGSSTPANEVFGGPGGGEPVVAEVMRAGYRWRGSVVRPAMVMVQG